jgi:hypothetical protein
MSKFLIVNADDFGLTQGITRGIIDGANNGIITSTSVLINEMIYEKISVDKEDCSKLGVGLHLNITQGRPILPAVDVTSLVSLDGYFKKPEQLFAHPDKIHPAQVEKEWRAQIAAFRTNFGIPDHLDSHHHVHLYPSLFNIFCQLAVEMVLPVRFPIQAESVPEFEIFPLSFAEGTELLESHWYEEQNLLDLIKLRYPDHFTDNFLYFNKEKPKTIERLLQSLPEGNNELMCHPGYVDERLPMVSTLTGRRKDELDILMAPSTREMLKDAGIELIKFSDL